LFGPFLREGYGEVVGPAGFFKKAKRGRKKFFRAFPQAFVKKG
jgi:hypothetical protein